MGPTPWSLLSLDRHSSAVIAVWTDSMLIDRDKEGEGGRAILLEDM